MPIYEVDFKIEAKTESVAKAKMSSLAMIAIKLNAKELAKLADTLEHDPITTALAKLKLGL